MSRVVLNATLNALILINGSASTVLQYVFSVDHIAIYANS